MCGVLYGATSKTLNKLQAIQNSAAHPQPQAHPTSQTYSTTTLCPSDANLVLTPPPKTNHRTWGDISKSPNTSMTALTFKSHSLLERLQIFNVL